MRQTFSRLVDAHSQGRFATEVVVEDAGADLSPDADFFAAPSGAAGAGSAAAGQTPPLTDSPPRRVAFMARFTTRDPASAITLSLALEERPAPGRAHGPRPTETVDLGPGSSGHAVEAATTRLRLRLLHSERLAQGETPPKIELRALAAELYDALADLCP